MNIASKKQCIEWIAINTMNSRKNSTLSLYLKIILKIVLITHMHAYAKN